MNRKRIIALLFMFAMVVLVACRKDETATGTLRMRLQDSPTNIYQQVNVDVQAIEVFTGSTETEGQWVSIGATPGVYDLLTLTNGVDLMMGEQQLPVGFISQIRLVLGSNNTVVMNNTIYPLDVPSGATSGLKINVHEAILADRTTEIYLDFDAQRSVVEQGSGTFSLKPVIRAFTMSTTGGVSGTVSVPGPGVTATLENGTDIYTTMVDASTGYFLIRGAKAGTYTLVIDAVGGTRPVKVTGVSVAIGSVNDIGVVFGPF